MASHWAVISRYDGDPVKVSMPLMPCLSMCHRQILLDHIRMTVTQEPLQLQPRLLQLCLSDGFDAESMSFVG